MANIIAYPLTGWNSYIAEADINNLLSLYALEFGITYTKLTPEQQLSLIVSASMQIRLCPAMKIDEKVSAPMDVQIAQIYLMQHLHNNPIEEVEANAKVITSEKVGSLAVTYAVPDHTKEAEAFPPIVYTLLGQYGCSKSKGFTQSRIVKG